MVNKKNQDSSEFGELLFILGVCGYFMVLGFVMGYMVAPEYREVVTYEDRLVYHDSGLIHDLQEEVRDLREDLQSGFNPDYHVKCEKWEFDCGDTGYRDKEWWD